MVQVIYGTCSKLKQTAAFPHEWAGGREVWGGGARCILSGWRVSSAFQPDTDTREFKPLPNMLAVCQTSIKFVTGHVLRSHLSWYSI